MKKFELNEKFFKKLVIIPIILILLSGFSLMYNYSKSGTFLEKGIDLEGGVQITLHYSEAVDSTDFESFLGSELGTTDVDVVTTTNPKTRQQETVVISVGGDIQEESIISSINSYLGLSLEQAAYSIKILGPALAGTFWSQAKWAFIFAFIFMAGVVLIHFRVLHPSMAVLIAISADILVILGFMNILGIKLSLATIAALLMILGYGVDSNILLSNKVIKEKEGDVFERIRGALKTGLTMSATTISALTALYIFANSIVLKQIAGVLLIGLIADLFNTWFLNSNLLLWRLK